MIAGHVPTEPLVGQWGKIKSQLSGFGFLGFVLAVEAQRGRIRVSQQKCCCVARGLGAVLGRGGGATALIVELLGGRVSGTVQYIQYGTPLTCTCCGAPLTACCLVRSTHIYKYLNCVFFAVREPRCITFK